MSGGESAGTAECSFPGTKESVSQARAWLRTVLEKFGVPEAAGENAVLVLSELCTNAISHSRSSGPHGSYLVRLRRGVSRIRLEVTDAGGVSEPMARRNGHPPTLHNTVPAPGPLAESGHGLALVEHFTTRWWTRGTPASRTVGAELSLNQTP